MDVKPLGLGVFVGTVADGRKKGVEAHIENPPILYTDLGWGHRLRWGYGNPAGRETEKRYPKNDHSAEDPSCAHAFLHMERHEPRPLGYISVSLHSTSARDP